MGDYMEYLSGFSPWYLVLLAILLSYAVARTVTRMGATAVEVAHPDEATNACLVREVEQVLPHVPVILGGHTNHDNVARRLQEADGLFVGTCLKSDSWNGRVDVERVRAYVDIVASLH